jgi:superfamily II RNA helicase
MTQAAMSTSEYLNIVNPAEPCSTMPQSLAMEYKFPLDPFQQHAIAAISRDENVLVTAKTGSGKTLVGEYQIAHSLAKGKRVFYTTPIKSLSNQKFHDLKSMFPSVGIMTGDLKFRPDADVVIMTTEILRNLLFKAGTATKELGITANLSLEGLDAVVFDECHYINDRDRGAVWEETMILLPPSVNLVLLSATIESPEIFAAWLGELKKKPIHLISTQYRIVPLQHGLYCGEQLVTLMDNKERFDARAYKEWLAHLAQQSKANDQHKAQVAQRRAGGYEDAPVARGAAGQKAFKHQMNELVGRLDGKGLLPALFFVFSRKNCERYAANMEHTLLDSSDTAAVKHILDFHLHRYGDALMRLPQYHTLRALLERGIAFHHSGLIPVLKEIVEILFGKGFVKLLFATETFAVGINMPTKTVVFTGYRKYDDATGGQRMLNTDEYIQMAGRAGRRGKDDKGLVLYLPDREPEILGDVQRMMTGARATFQSRMTFHYDFLLKTMQAKNLDWLKIMHQSYWYKRHEIVVAGIQKELAAEEAKLAAMTITPQECAAMEEYDTLVVTMKNAVNAAKKDAQRARSAWENSHMGPRWNTLIKGGWSAYCISKREVATLKKELEAAENPSRGVWPSIDALAAMGFVTRTLEQSTDELTLTPLGVMATEVNEGHPILMSKAYEKGLLRGLGAEGIVAALVAFAQEGDAEMPALNTLNVPADMRNALWDLHEVGEECQRLEAGVGAPRAPRDSYWDLNTTWVEPMWRWINEEATVQELCGDYGFYEGNFMRLLSKAANLLEEWRSLATLALDTEMLEKMRGLETKIMRDVAVCDSLYLRI